MTNPDTPRHIEVSDGDQSVAAAEVTASKEAHGTARASLHATSGHIAPAIRANLVDAVMDLPEVRASDRLEATVPLGDGESLERLRDRTEDAVTRPAGSTVLLDANIPPDSQPGDAQEPDGGTDPSLPSRCQGRVRQRAGWLAEWPRTGAGARPHACGFQATKPNTSVLRTTISPAAMTRSRDRRRLRLACSVPGIASSRVSLVKTANSDPRSGSSASSDFSIRSRARRLERPGGSSVPANAAPPVATAYATEVWSGQAARPRELTWVRPGGPACAISCLLYQRNKRYRH
jgi:hypothetical protein